MKSKKYIVAKYKETMFSRKLEFYSWFGWITWRDVAEEYNKKEAQKLAKKFNGFIISA